MSNRESHALAWAQRRNARKLRADEVLTELERARKVFTESKRRVADEYYVEQVRGEIEKSGKPCANVEELPCALDLHLAHKDGHEVRMVFNAENDEQGITRRALVAIRRLVEIWLWRRGNNA